MKRFVSGCWMVVGGLLCASIVLLAAPARAATFSNSNLSGPFGFQLNKFGTCPNIVAVEGLLDFNAAGGVTVSFEQFSSNSGGTGPKVSSGTMSGIYNVNSDGTGTMSFTHGPAFAFTIDSTGTSAERIELISTSIKAWSCAQSGYAIQQ